MSEEVPQEIAAAEAPKKTFEQLLLERGINTKVSVDFMFGAHGSAEDAELQKETIDKCDIYIPEYIGMDEDILQDIQEVSFGTTTPATLISLYNGSAFRDEYSMAMLTTIYNTKKIIGNIDIPSDHELEDMRLGVAYDKRSVFEYKNPLVASEILFEASKTFNYIQLEREAYIAEKFPTEVLRLFEKYPELKEKEAVKIAIFMGAAHIPIVRKVELESGVKPKTNLLVSPMVFNQYYELMKRETAGLEISDSLKLHALMSYLSNLILVPYDMPSFDSEAFTRKVSSIFTDEEIKSIWVDCHFAESDGITICIKNRLLEKGLDLPKNKEELDKFVGRK